VATPSNLLVGYLQKRQPALDYRSLDTLAQQRGRTSGLAGRAITPVSTA
jgi:hypothetical protein